MLVIKNSHHKQTQVEKTDSGITNDTNYHTEMIKSGRNADKCLDNIKYVSCKW